VDSKLQRAIVVQHPVDLDALERRRADGVLDTHVAVTVRAVVGLVLVQGVRCEYSRPTAISLRMYSFLRGRSEARLFDSHWRRSSREWFAEFCSNTELPTRH
jgi:hypothetical protein